VSILTALYDMYSLWFQRRWPCNRMVGTFKIDQDGALLTYHRSSDVLVWSDTLKPDIPDLATAIQRAYALNDRSLPRKNSQRQQRNSVMNDISSPGSATLIEPPSSQSPSVKRKRTTPSKHWADGIPPEELKHATNLLAPFPARQQPRAESQRRPSLPTRTQITKPTAVPSNHPKLPFTQPDPSAAIPSQEWRMRRAAPGPTMIFKPTNPRKSQAAGQDVPVALSTGAQGPARREQKQSLYGTELTQPTRHSGSSQARRNGPRETATAPSDLSHFSTPRGRDVPTPEASASRSPTLVNETLFTTSPHGQHDQQMGDAEEEEEYMPERIPVSAEYDGAVKKTTHVGGESERIAMGNLRDTPDLEDLSSEDGGPSDEEIEHNVQQFISKRVQKSSMSELYEFY
jgi:hypothetical protein